MKLRKYVCALAAVFIVLAPLAQPLARTSTPLGPSSMASSRY